MEFKLFLSSTRTGILMVICLSEITLEYPCQKKITLEYHVKGALCVCVCVYFNACLIYESMTFFGDLILQVR